LYYRTSRDSKAAHTLPSVTSNVYIATDGNSQGCKLALAVSLPLVEAWRRTLHASSCCLKRKNQCFKSLISRKCKCRFPNELHLYNICKSLPSVYCVNVSVQPWDTITTVPYGTDSLWKVSLSGGSERHNAWFFGPTRVSILNGISIDSAVFAGLTNVTTHRHTTDWSRYSVIAIYCCDAAE